MSRRSNFAAVPAVRASSMVFPLSATTLLVSGRLSGPILRRERCLEPDGAIPQTNGSIPQTEAQAAAARSLQKLRSTRLPGDGVDAPLRPTGRSLQDRSEQPPPEPEHTINVAFFDTRENIDTSAMWNAAELVRQPGTDVRFHALLGHPQAVRGRLPGFTIHSLDELLPPHAKCLLQGLQALSYSQGRAYLYKPLLHWALPGVRRLVLLDTDVVLVRGHCPTRVQATRRS